MSRYLLLFLLNLPFVLAGMLSTLTQYKMKKATRRRFIVQMILWIVILTGLAFAEPLYNWLFTNNLTASEPLSLFDVVQITAIVIILYLVNRMRAKLEETESRLHDLHKELSIKLSSDKEL